MLPWINLLGLSISTYKIFFYVALATVPVFLFALRKQFGFSKGQAAFYSFIVLAFGLLSAYMTAVLKRGFLAYASGGLYSDAEVLRNYGIPIFLPVFLLMYCAVRKDDFRKLSDYIAPCVYSVMFFVKIGCTFWGCCYGEPDDHGIWSAVAGYKAFPVQLYDAMTSLCIVLICLFLIKRLSGKRYGYVYPVGGILFALTKGFWECFRVHESVYERYFMGTTWTLWQYWLLVLLIACVVWLIILTYVDRQQAVRTY